MAMLTFGGEVWWGRSSTDFDNPTDASRVPAGYAANNGSAVAPRLLHA